MASPIVKRKGQVLSRAAAGLIGMSVAASPALAENATPAHAQEIGSKSVERSGSAKSVPRKAPRKPDRSGSFIYEIIDTIRARSGDFCTRYGSPADCLEEAEVCLTMRDDDDNQFRLCLNTVPGEEGRDGGKMQGARTRR
jgi:hypothetical protein